MERLALINGSMGDMAERGLLASSPALRRRKEIMEEASTASAGKGKSPKSTGARTMAMIRLLLRIWSEWPRSGDDYYTVSIREVAEDLLFLLLQNVSTAFEDLRAADLLATVVSLVLQRDFTPSLLWISSHKDTPAWVPGFFADVAYPGPVLSRFCRVFSDRFYLHQ